MKNRLIILFLILFFVFSNIFCEVTNKVVAKIDKDIILLSEFEEIVNPIINKCKKYNPKLLENGGEKRLKEEILNQLIDQRVILQEAKRKKITVSKRELDKQLEDIKSKFKTEDEYKNEMKNNNLTEDKFKKEIEDSLLIQKFIDSEIRNNIKLPTDDDSKKYFDEHPEEMIEPETVRIRHILIKLDGKTEQDVLKTIKDIKSKIDKDKKTSFADYATKYSEDDSKSKGGDLGIIYKGQGLLSPEIEEVVFKLNVGQVSDPVKTQFGYHIFRCEEKKLEQKKTFEEVKEYIKNFLYRQDMDKKIQDLIKKLKLNIKIVKNEF